jgi:hypothetical protein
LQQNTYASPAPLTVTAAGWVVEVEVVIVRRYCRAERAAASLAESDVGPLPWNLCGGDRPSVTREMYSMALL